MDGPSDGSAPGLPADVREELEAVGLLDPDAPDADEMSELLAYLHRQGLRPDQLLLARDRGRLVSAASDHRLRQGQDPITVGEFAELSGLSEQTVRRIWRASGLVDPADDARVLWPSEVPVFQLFEEASEFIGGPEIEQFTRVIATAMSRVAEAAVAMFLSSVELPLAADGEPRLVDRAVAGLEAQLALEEVPFVMENIFRHHVEQAAGRSMSSWSRDANEVVVSVGFVDLVGYSSRANDADGSETGALVGRFARIATDTVVAGDARLVKMIGDEVMFVCVDAERAVSIALGIQRRVRDEGIGETRAGLAHGSAVWQDGDYYGATVNLAARAVSVAGRGELLVNASVADATREMAGVSTAPPVLHALKGFARPQRLFPVEPVG